MSEPPATHFRRSLYEFRHLWELWRVRIPVAALNLGAVAVGLILSAGEDTGTTVLATVGLLALAALASAFIVFVIAYLIAPHRILKDRVVALEQRPAAALGEQGQFHIDHVQNLHIGPGQLEMPTTSGTALTDYPGLREPKDDEQT